jgi:hypothetical protein
MGATKLRLTPEARERRRTEALSKALIALGDMRPTSAACDWSISPTDEELDAIADACNEILNGIDQWLDDREDARFAAKYGCTPRKRTTVNKRARKPSNKK